MRRAVVMLACLVLLWAAVPATAQTEESPTVATDELGLTTPFPAVAVEPGEQVTFDLTVTTPQPTVVDLTIEGVPDGWNATFRGGGYELDSVMAGPGLDTEVSLSVSVPAGAAEETAAMTVVAAAGSETAELPVRVRVSAAAGGEVTLEPDFPGLRIPAGDTASFDLTLRNDTPADLEFELDATGPAGWDVSAQPAGQAQAATFAVAPGSTETVRLDATAPPRAEAAQYPVSVVARAGETEVTADLVVEVVGSYSMDLTTTDQRLNADVTVGSSSELGLAIVNTGTAPLAGISLSATPPRGWEVTFDRDALEPIPPGETAIVTATIAPSDEAVTGDYIITFSASGDEVNNEIEVRTTVTPSALWGIVGVGLIALTLAALAWVFRRFGRR